MLSWVPALILAVVIAGALTRRSVKARKARLNAARRVVEAPNSFYASRDVQDQVDAEWYNTIELDQLHEVNREYVERLLKQIHSTGVDSLRRDERAFMERMANLEGRDERRGTMPEQDPWPSPA